MSGAPGYVTGAPLLVGTLAASGGAVARLPRGAPLLATAADGLCAPAGALVPGTPVARFAVNAASACALELTRAELRTFCTTGRGRAWEGTAPQIAQHFLGLPERLFLGVWGASDPATLADWLEVTTDASGAVRAAVLLRACLSGFWVVCRATWTTCARWPQAPR